MMMIILTTIMAGVAFLALGIFKLGGLVRFLPYPVMGGFLAGTGWLLITGALSLAVDLSARRQRHLAVGDDRRLVGRGDEGHVDREGDDRHPQHQYQVRDDGEGGLAGAGWIADHRPELLRAAGADLVLNGHDHGYERFAPQSPAGVADTTLEFRLIARCMME